MVFSLGPSRTNQSEASHTLRQPSYGTPRSGLPVNQTPAIRFPFPSQGVHLLELPRPTRSQTPASTHEGHLNTENSSSERVTRSGRVVKTPHRLDW
ncbi:hypothetical protein ABFA07_019222 [Porites harrisoni]